MSDLMEVESDALEEDRELNDQTLESKMIMYHELGLEDVISPEKLRDILASIEGEREISVILESGKSKAEIPTVDEIRKIAVVEEEISKESAERDELKEELIFGGIETKI